MNKSANNERSHGLTVTINLPRSSDGTIKQIDVDVNIFLNRNRGCYYFWYYDENGKQRNRSCGTTSKSEAKKIAKEKIAQITINRHKTAEGRKRLTVSQFRDEYLQNNNKRLKPSTQRLIKSAFSSLLIYLKVDKRIEDVTFNECYRYVHEFQSSQHRAITNYGHLRSAFRYAAKLGYIEENHFEHIDKPEVQIQEETEFLEPKDFKRICAVLPEGSYYERTKARMIKLAFETGARLGELRHIEIPHINFKDRNLKIKSSHVHRTKNDKTRKVPLGKRAMKLIQDQLDDVAQHFKSKEVKFLFAHNRSGRVIPEKTVSDAFREARIAVFPDRPRVHFHSLRHSFCTNALEIGAPIQEVKEIAGHSDIKTTMKYVHLSKSKFDRTRQVIDKLHDEES